jgi:hypothetical protein
VLDGATQDLDDRALAGAVLADERMHLSRTDFQLDVAQRAHRAIGFPNTGRADPKVLVVHRRPPSH